MRTLTEKSDAAQQSRSRTSSLGHAVGGQGHQTNSVFHLQHALGNQAVLRMLQSQADKSPAESVARDSPQRAHDRTEVSAKPADANAAHGELLIGAPGDACELEADRVADHVMRMPGPVAAALPSATGGATCPQCSSEQADEQHDTVMRSSAVPRSSSPGSSTIAAPPMVHQVLQSPGHPLDAETRAFMEPRFGRDFGSVRLHTGGAARKSAEEVGAQAYTVGGHIVLRNESSSPALLAHELAHVVQQASALSPLVQRGPGDGKGGPKFFDPSRGPLTGAEKAKLLALRRSLNLPDTPTPSDTSIVGILITETGEEIPFHSGERGGYFGGVRPADVKGGPGSGTNRINRTHVETWAANAMRQRGLKKAVLLIELEPCAVCGGYGKGHPQTPTRVPGVSGQLPEDAQLIVVDGDQATYFRQTPTDPQRPMRLPTKSPNDPSEDKPAGKAPAATNSEAGGEGTGTSSQVKSQGGVKAPAAPDVEPSSAATGTSTQVKVEGGGKAPAAPDVEHGGTGNAGATAPSQETGGAPSTPGRFSGVSIEISTGVATLGADYLAGYLRQKVDQKSATRQIEALMAIAQKQINASPDEAVKKMMVDPFKTVYAWVYLDNSVITTLGVDPLSGDPNLSASSPLISLSRIDYQFIPVDRTLIDSFPKITGGGRHLTTTTPIVVDLVLKTPPLEALIDYAKARNLPIGDLLTYAQGRHEYALSSVQTGLEARQRIQDDYQATNVIFQNLQAAFHAAQKRKDVELQKSLAQKLVSVGRALVTITDQFKPVGESIQHANETLKYWEHILDLLKAGASK